jgi:hypothetical protein
MVQRPDRVRLRKGELFHWLNYTPHPAQSIVHASRARFRVMACGTRFGKTTVAVHECLAALLTPGDTRLGWLIAPTFDLGQRTFKRVVESLHVHFEHRIRTFDPRTHRIVVVNFGGGVSELRAKSADRPVSLLGEALDFVVMDECTKIRSDVWSEHASPRLLDRKGWALLLSTPDGPGWFYDQFRRARRDPEYAAWQFPTATNPYIAPELIEAERGRLAEDVFRAQFLAAFIGVPIEPCDVCHGPKPGHASRVIICEGDASVSTCPVCGLFVDEGGECLIHHDGKDFVPLRVLRIHPSPEMVPLPSATEET